MRRQNARLKRIGLSMRYLRGSGIVEQNVTFADVWKVDAVHLPPAAEALIMRYLRTRIASRSYFGSECWGLPVLHGARSILSLAAHIVWHARVAAACEQRTEILLTDVKTAVMLVDHSYGHMGNLSILPIRHALQIVNRPHWPQNALAYVMFGTA